MDWLLEPLSHPFMQRALLAGIATACACAAMGVLIVQRRLSLLSDGLAHATFGGIALSLLLGTSPEAAPWSAIPFTALVALGIGLLQRRARLGSDASISIFLSVSFALGVVFLGLRSPRARPVDIEGLLFGSILGISPSTLRVMVLVSALALLALAFLWTRLAYATFDDELALLSGVNTTALESVFLVLTAVVVVTAIQAVGVILVGSFIVLPATTARLLNGTLGGVTLVSLGLAVGGCVVGLYASYHLNMTSGATIVLTLAAGFTAALFLSARR